MPTKHAEEFLRTMAGKQSANNNAHQGIDATLNCSKNRFHRGTLLRRSDDKAELPAEGINQSDSERAVCRHRGIARNKPSKWHVPGKDIKNVDDASGEWQCRSCE